MDPEIRRKVEEAVVGILKKADMEAMTEFKVRAAAAEQLGMDLSSVESKVFVRSVVEGFLISGLMEDGVQKQMPKEEVKERPETSGKEDGIICKVLGRFSLSLYVFV